MKLLYLDCGMGAAGDMLTAALLELHPHPDEILRKLNEAGIPGVIFERRAAVKCGITGTQMSVTVNGEEEESHDHHHHDDDEHDHHHHDDDEHDHHHHHDDEHDHDHHHHHVHRGMEEIEYIIRSLNLPEEVKTDALNVYGLIAEAESHAHNCPVSEIHFHEVGTMDAVADIAAVCLLIHELSPDRIAASPVCTGSGQVHCMHGILPVPAPATAWLLRDIPMYAGEYKMELCTPTGAALLRYFVKEFAAMPVMRTQAVGYGMGKKDLPAANCVRALLGDEETAEDTVTELVCTIDDMTGEDLAFALDRITEAGARDAYTVPVYMKKSRPGIQLCVLCTEQDKRKVLDAVFRHTSTIGVRERLCRRFVMPRQIREIETPYGSVRCKQSSQGTVQKRKLEFEDLSRIARENGLTLQQLRGELEQLL